MCVCVCVCVYVYFKMNRFTYEFQCGTLDFLSYNYAVHLFLTLSSLLGGYIYMYIYILDLIMLPTILTLSQIRLF